ncbi:hypothetical protein UA08_05057 [Talaromyces atroroseus]|uniref:Uncharacterized protein n=1 Tax=Talaromyces atroroseus TaxID=1441469 RepID=A0A225AJ95_TALAT|nr:hypothetical protein UA08_05057 [Talaromyces atroroseus]OKL59423.1 hypothetical protein UA08_05057 [Talaromyces atroroseus]
MYGLVEDLGSAYWGCNRTGFQHQNRKSRKRELRFWAAYFNEYSSNFETYYFGVRARALIAFVSDVVTIVASQMITHWLDWKSIDPKKRVTYGWYYVILVHIVTWIYAWIIQGEYTTSPPMLDYSSPEFVKRAFALFLWSFAQQTVENWLHYFVGSLTDNIAELTRLTGILRGQESFDEAVPCGLNSRNWYGGRVPMAVNTILLGLCIIPTWIVVHRHAPQETQEKLSEPQSNPGTDNSGMKATHTVEPNKAS